jgi:hypothetical protein
MKKILLSLLFLTAVEINAQVYFNYRFDFTDPVIGDGAKSTIVLNDGYGIIGGTGALENNFWHRIGLIKIDFNGTRLFTKTFGDSISEYYFGNPGCLIHSDETSFVAVGSKNTYLSNWVLQEGLLYKFNDLFDTLFTRKYGDKIPPVDTAYLFQQIKLSGDDFIIAGGKMPYGLSTKAILIKTDGSGNVLFEKSYGTGYYYDGYSVICTSDGGYAIGGYVSSSIPPPNYSGDPIIIKTDSAGNQEWIKNVGGPYPDTPAFLTESNDGNIIAGTCYCDSVDGGGPHVEGNFFRKINIIKIDNSGTILWNKKYGKSEYSKNLGNIRMNIDGSLIATGKTHNSKEYSSKDLGWILKITGNGDSLWYREYAICHGENSNNRLYDVIETPDNGYLACGMVYPYPPDTGSVDGWVIKVDSLGCEAPGDCWVGIKPENLLINNGFDLYPNPAEQQTEIKLRITCLTGRQADYELRIRIRLFDLYGREVKNVILPRGQTEYRLDVSGLPSGLYMTVVESGENIIGREKLVVQ